MDESNNLESLSGPVPPPGPLGQAPITTGGFSPNTQRFAPALSRTTPANTTATQPTMPIGSGETMYETPDFDQEDISNVGGVIGVNAQPAEASGFEIPEPETEQGSKEYRKENRIARRTKRKERRKRF